MLSKNPTIYTINNKYTIIYLKKKNKAMKFLINNLYAS
jgi:hypothetical protein